MKINKMFILFTIMIFIFANLYSEEYRLKQIELDSQYKMDKEILENYGNLWICYQISQKSYFKYGKERTPITVLKYYFEKNNVLYYLGKLDVNGIYDKNDKLLCSNIITKERFISYKALGFMESSLDDPFYTGQYYLDADSTLGALEPYASISIDFDINSMIVTHVSD